MSVFSRIRAALKGAPASPAEPSAPEVEPAVVDAPAVPAAEVPVASPPPVVPVAPPSGVFVELAEWATELGLRSRIAPPASPGAGAQPHILWGTRGGRQVFIRLGVDEVGEGLELVSTRGLRQIVVVRAAFATFELRGENGKLAAAAGGAAAPAAVTEVLADLDPSSEAWRDLRVVAGPEGLVTTRPQLPDAMGAWVEDLRLAERLAAATAAEPLLAERVGPAWKVPYGVAGKRRGQAS